MDEVEKPKHFWLHPVGRVMSTVTHDVCNATSSAGASISLIRNHLKKDELDREYILERLSRIEKAFMRIDDATDYAYKKLKEKEGY